MSERPSSPRATAPPSPPAAVPDAYLAVSKARLEALSDGIYAIALTLLVLELRLPALPGHPADAGLLQALAAIGPKLATWLLSFWVIAMFWVAQQRLFRLAARVDAGFLRRELSQLCLITLFPFSNALMGEHGVLVTAAAWYGGHLLAIALLSWSRTSYFVRHPALHGPEMSPQFVRPLRIRALVLTGCALATFALAFVAPGWNTLAMLPTILISRLARGRYPAPAGSPERGKIRAKRA